VLGLGCENNYIDSFKEVLGEYDSQRVKFLNCQDSEDEVADGMKLIQELTDYASQFKREPITSDKLIVGLKCGGSDGFSGITGNPAVGAFSDLLVSRGGTSILTEVPEMFGAETLLMERSENEDIFNKTVDMINGFKNYFISHKQEIYENPSPGNKEGGISTLEDKSLGCTQKSGQSTVVDVLKYAQPVKTPGLNLLTSPGNDIVACTALVASGAHIVLFTTGRGNPLGCPVPTVKISTNTALYEKKKHWIDFNAGDIINGQSIEECGQNLYNYVLKVAQGEKAQNEKKGYREISIFKDGVIL
jgi:altronate hydrolase